MSIDLDSKEEESTSYQGPHLLLVGYMVNMVHGELMCRAICTVEELLNKDIGSTLLSKRNISGVEAPIATTTGLRAAHSPPPIPG